MTAVYNLVDSHCHLDRLDLMPYQGDLDLAINAAAKQGVSHILCVAVDLATIPQVIAIAERYPHVTASIGVHPTEELAQAVTIDELVALARHPKVVAIGETGLDYYRLTGDPAWQQERFRTHIRAARQIGKPLIIHTRQARADTIAILQQEGAEAIGGVLHCFTEDWTMAQQALDLNFYISFSGIVTFKNALELKEIAKKVPLDRMLIETDAPYLAPVPFRGKSNEPAYVRYIAEYIAELRGIPITEIAAQTTENFYRLFSYAKTT